MSGLVIGLGCAAAWCVLSVVVAVVIGPRLAGNGDHYPEPEEDPADG